MRDATRDTMPLTCKRIRRRAVLTGLALTALGAAVAEADMPPMGWVRTAPDCTVPAPDSETAVVACGEYGRFYFRHGELPEPACVPAASGSEDLLVYPIEVPYSSSTRAFGRDGGPWAALIDWSGSHIHRVAELILQVSDGLVDVEPFDLESARDDLFTGVGGPSDAHVLTRLCQLAQIIADGDEAPVVLHMGFGRSADERDDCSSGAEGLSCEIQDVLEHLYQRHGVVAVAEAGEHGELVFPALARTVIAAGALDLAAFERFGEVRPSLVTPPEANSLMPGFGLWVDSGGPDRIRALFASAAFATAFQAGWLAGVLAAGEWLPSHPLPLDGLWAPVATADGWGLGYDSELLPGSELEGPSTLIRRAIGEEPGLCDGPAPAEYPQLALGEGAQELPELSLTEMVAAAERWPPLPCVMPCVPCHGGGQQANATAAEHLLLDLSFSTSVGSFYQLRGLLLQVGPHVHRLVGGDDLALLDALEHGEVDALGISGVDVGEVREHATPLALVFSLTMEDRVPFWHKVPITLHGHDLGPP